MTNHPGDPLSGKPPPAEQAAPTPPPAASHREGELVAAVPDPGFAAVEALSAAEQTELRRARDEEEEARGDATLTALRVPAALRYAWFFGFGLLGAVLTLYLCGQVTVTLTALAESPLWLQSLVLPVLLAAGGFLAFAIVALAVVYARTRPSPQIRLASLEALWERECLRATALRQASAARQKLIAYLQTYPVGEGEGSDLAALGFTPEELLALRRVRDELCDATLTPAVSSWLATYRDHFQAVLDRRAQARIRRHALRAAGLTMVMPVSLLDLTLVVTTALTLVRELCQIYRVRADRFGAGVICVRAILAAFVAGEAQDLSQKGAGSVADLVTESSPLAAAGVELVGAKLAEGTTNFIFMSRLGSKTRQLLQPVG